jgi:Tol biopolymer transport system component
VRRLSIVVLAGCGRIAFDPIADAQGDSPPWGPATQVAELTSGFSDDDPTLTGDMLEIYFASDRTGSEDIWRATRTRIDLPWEQPQPVTELNTTTQENTPEVSFDGLTIMLSSGRGGGSDNIYIATRPDAMTAWSTPVNVSELNSSGPDVAPVMMPDKLELFMARKLSDDHEIHRATRTSPTGTWSTPLSVEGLAGPGFDSDQHLTFDGARIYWCSQRSGNSDLWTAVRDGIGQPFTQVAPVDDLNTALEEDDPWISPDGRTLYFSRGTEFGVEMSIWVSTR